SDLVCNFTGDGVDDDRRLVGDETELGETGDGAAGPGTARVPGVHQRLEDTWRREQQVEGVEGPGLGRLETEGLCADAEGDVSAGHVPDSPHCRHLSEGRCLRRTFRSGG